MLEALGVEWIQPDQLSSVNDMSKVRSDFSRIQLMVDIRLHAFSIFLYGSTGQ